MKKISLRGKILALILSGLMFFNFSFSAFAATITVNTLNDTGGAGDCELRDAISSANSNTAVDNCNAGEPSPTIDNIDFSLSGTINLNGTQLPTITETVRIDGDNDNDTNPDITIDAGNASRVFEVDSPSVTIDGLNFLNGAATGDSGGTIKVKTAADLVLLNSSIDNSTADQGGAIFSEADTGQIYFDNVDISNTTADEGGAIYIGDENINVDPETIDFSIDHTNITGSAAVNGNGGAIYIGKNNEAQIRRTTIINTQAARNGGAIYDDGEDTEPPSNTSDLNFDELTIDDSTANTDGANYSGGGIYLGPGLEAASDGLLGINDASAYSGGGIFVGGGNGSFTLGLSDLITNSTAEHGGGIFVDTGAFMQSGGLFGSEPTISFNEGITSGGGIEIAENTNGVNLNHTKVINNHTFENGAGIFVRGDNSLNIYDSIIQDNTADFSGGGIFSTDDYTVGLEKNIYAIRTSFDGNSAVNAEGGAIYAGNRSVLTLDQVTTTTSGNTAGINGGFLNMGTSGADSTLTLTGSHITNNSATDSCGAIMSGGGYNTSLPTINISSTSFQNNYTTTGNGGALCLNLGSMDLNNVDFTNNSAADVGGALFVNDNGSNSSVYISNGSNFISNTASTDGGAIYLSQNSNIANVEVDGSTFDLNSAGGAINGGAIYNQGGSYTFLNTNFTAGAAFVGDYGGAIYNNNGSVSLTDSSISNFKVNNDGGAIYNFKGTLDVRTSTVSNNSSTDNGAGIYTDGSSAQATLRRSYIGQNSATADGGGIYLNDGNLTVENSTIESNNAVSGAGLYVNNTLGRVGIDVSTIANNSATLQAGGIALNSTPIDMSSTILSGNTAPSGPDCAILNASINLSNLGYNIYTNSANCGTFYPSDITDVSAGLDTLALNGGTTLNYSLLANSPAINSGSSTLPIDQRGVIRPKGGTPDIGAYEYEDAIAPIITEITPVPTPSTDNTPTFTFNTTEDGSVNYAGGCFSDAVSSALIGNVTVTFNPLPIGTYSLCSITVTDVFGNISNILTLTSFTIIAPPTPPTPPSGGGGSSGGSAAFGQPATSGGEPANNTNPPTPNLPSEPIIPTEPSSPTEPTTPVITPTAPPTPATIINQPATSPATTPTEPVVTTTEPSSPTETPSTPAESPVFPVVNSSVPTTYQEFIGKIGSGSCDPANFKALYGISVDMNSDADADGLSDALECEYATNPTSADTDSDGKTDAFEALNLNTNPTKADQFNPANVDTDFVIVTLPENSLVTADDSPIFLGLSKPVKFVNVYLFDASVVDQGEMDDFEFEQYLFKILQKYIGNKLDPEKPEEAKFIGKIKGLGNATTDENGLFTLDSELSLRDNKYIAIGASRSSFSKPINFEVDSSLAYITPTIEKLSGQNLSVENLNGDTPVQLGATDTKPVLTGKIAVPSKIVAIWQSNISSSALLADALDKNFRLTPPNNLEPGNHTVILTAYRSSDNAQSKSVKINFTIPTPLPVAPTDFKTMLLVVAGILDLTLLVLVIRRRKKTSAQPTGLAQAQTELPQK